MVLGFEPTTYGTCVSSHNHLTRAPAKRIQVLVRSNWSRRRMILMKPKCHAFCANVDKSKMPYKDWQWYNSYSITEKVRVPSNLYPLLGPTSSVTRWLDYLFNILPLPTMKICPKEVIQSSFKILSNPISSLKNCRRLFNVFCQIDEIFPNLVSLSSTSSFCQRW